MKLLLYDKYFDSLIKLPRQIQKKTIDFQKKFRENSKSSAIHLEPIHNFKDPLLRTARIDQSYRAILRAPESGDTYYLLWVDNHDEAMNWARNKVFHWNMNTQSIQVFTAPEEIEDERLSSESSQEEISSDGLFHAFEDAQLLKIGVPEVLIPSIRKLKDLDGLDHLEKYLPVDAYENLFYLADGANIEQLIYEVQEGKVASEEYDEQLKSINNQRSFIELTDDEVFNEVLAGELNKWKLYLHPSQRKLVEGDFNGSFKVTGGAGTGKTVAAFHRLKYLAENSQDERPVLFTTFTNALTNNLQELSKELEIGGSFVIINIDRLVLDLAKQYECLSSEQKIIGYPGSKSSDELWEELLDSKVVEYDKDFLIDEYQDVILYNNVHSQKEYFRVNRAGRGKAISRSQRKGLWEIFEYYEQLKSEQNLLDRYKVFNQVTDYLNTITEKPFSYCIADEVQDFSNVELRFLRSLVEEKENDLFLVGDPLQKIYARKIFFSQAGINVRGRRSKRLRINYRTTEEIKRLALSVVKEITFDDFDGEAESKKGYVSLFHGHTPTYQTFNSKNNEVDYVITELSKIKESDIPYQEVAISARTREGIKEFKSALHKNGIPYYDITETNTGDVSGVRLSTFHSLKGLEFKFIFLVDVNRRTSPLLPHTYTYWDERKKEEYLKSEKALMYVAISRAIQRVYISGVGEVSESIMLKQD